MKSGIGNRRRQRNSGGHIEKASIMGNSSNNISSKASKQAAKEKKIKIM